MRAFMRSIVAEQPHVLVVDDDSRIAAALRRALIYEGYHVEVAPDGQIALNRARERMPDLAILDIMMPGIDGLEVTRRLRAEGDVPILLLTAKDGTADRVKGLDSGADVYLGYRRQKLEHGGGPRLLQTVRGVGYILKEE